MTQGADAAADIFIVGPVRSGTSWLQTMLAEHPDLASPPETHLFANYLGPLDAAWRRDRARVDEALAEPGRHVGHGLATVVTDDEFVALLRTFYATVRELVLSAKPGARRLLEKTPDHATAIDTIERVVPDAAVLFLVRDPRDVVRSILAASREPWGRWAPSSLEDATGLWLRNVRPFFARKRDPRVMLLRYEDLRADPATIERVASFLGLGEPSSWSRTGAGEPPTARSSTVVRGDAAARGLDPYDAPGFSFHDRSGRRELDRYETAYVVTRCRDEMRALGYPTDIGPIPARLRARLLTRVALRRIRSLRRAPRTRAPHTGAPVSRPRDPRTTG